jgi:hypothetical protein
MMKSLSGFFTDCGLLEVTRRETTRSLRCLLPLTRLKTMKRFERVQVHECVGLIRKIDDDMRQRPRPRADLQSTRPQCRIDLLRKDPR